MPPLVSRALAVLAAATLALAALPAAARAQKALVYCPVGIDVAGCDRAAAALAPDFPGGVDRAYDGSGGTIDVKTAELWDYAVLVVPSLADGADRAPYALLRDAAVAERLHDALMGRVALWSGTPDQGTTNREAKDGLIRSLARWAAGNYGTVKGPGLVVLQDLSDEVGSRYGWVKGITGAAVTADSAVLSYASVRAMTATGAAIIGSSGSAIAYPNMASLGFYLPQGAANVTLDAVGQTGTTQGGQVVLVTSPGGNTGKAVVSTDMDDYAPGSTVTITGTGFAPGETVNMVLHEDPEVHDNRTLTSVADGSGNFTNTSFAPEDHDVGVRFILTAIGATSGVRAEATFTDAVNAATPADFFTVTGSPSSPNCTTTPTGPSAVGTRVCAQSTVTTNPGSPTNNFVEFLWFRQGETSPAFTERFPAGSATLGMSATASASSVQTPDAAGTWTVKICQATSKCSNNPTTLSTSTIVITSPTANTTVSVNPATATYPAGSVSLSATVSSTSTVGVGTVTFTVKQGATTIGSATTSATVSGGSASVTYSLPAGTGAGSYTVEAAYSGGTGFNPSSGTGTLTIGKASQTILFAALPNKSYGDAPFAVSATASSGLAVSFGVLASSACTVSGSTVTLTGGGSCTVIASQGGDANYLPASSVNQSFTIAAKAVTPVITADNKEYDGTTSATILTRSLTGVLPSDAANVTLTGGTATFADAAVANGKTVTGTGFTLGGSAAANYTLATTSATTTANITVKTVAPSVTVADKEYDGNTNATITARSLVAGGVIGSDAVSLTGGSATFANKTVGANKPVSVTGLSLTGAAAGNYVLSSTTASATASITAKALTATITAASKPYDGNANAVASGQPLTGVVAGDAVLLAVGSATFDNKNVGTDKTVTAALSLTGADAANYTVNPTATATANITALGVSPVVAVSNKPYDGNTTATITSRSVTGVVGTDVVMLVGGTATFADKSVASAKPVSVTGLSLGGADAGNYALGSTTAATTADISARTLTVSATGVNKEYDGNATATVTLGDDRVSGDALTTGYASAAFNNKSVGTGKPVAVSGISISGTDAGNYVLAATTAATTANITAKEIAGHITADSKTYDGNTSATLLTRTLTGVIGSDNVSLTGGTATFADRNVGNGKTVTLAGAGLTGGDAGNYSLAATPITTMANITAKEIGGQITAANKTYDGATTATILTRTLTGVIAGDAVSLTGGSAAFDNKNVGVGKTVTASGLALSGTDAGNYSLSAAPVTTLANIDARALVVSATGVNKEYDGNATATVTLSDDRVSGDALTLAFASASFADKHVGDDKPVSVNGISVGGADAGNYTANTSAATTANITRRALTASATAESKTYDATTAATVSLSTDKLSGDVVTTTFTSALFADKNVGTGKTVTVSGIAIAGGDAGNYNLTSPTAAALADITALGITGSVTAQNKIYDGNTSATLLTRTLAGVLGTDVVSYVGGSATFADKNVANGKTVTATGLSLSGADAGNYTVNTSATATANITALAITGSITASNKVYDGTTAATIATRSLTGVVSGDVVSYTGGTATFADANAGLGKTVTATGLVLAGADAGNYTVNSGATTTADISKAQPLLTMLSSPTIIQGEISTTLAGKIGVGALVPPGSVGITIGSGGSAMSMSATVNPATGAFSAAFGTATLPANTFVIAYSYAESANFLAASGTGSLNVTANAAPVVEAITGPALPVQLGSGPVTINATFSDVDVPQSTPYAATINWGDNTGPIAATVLSDPSTGVFGTVRGTHTYAASGVYTVKVTVNDKIPGTGTRTYEQYVVVYDPTGGFVTGGGWINSPAGAYAANPALGGKATFGFVSKYQKGATAPSGNTQFQFHAAGMDFKSTSYEWLVISGPRAQYKGSGTINGSGDYGFILTAVEGDMPGGGGTDRFRIKIVNKATGLVVYDNQIGATDDAGLTTPGTLLGGGSVQIQSK